MIDDEITYNEKGYRSTDLNKGSHKRVWRVCDECGDGEWIEYVDRRELCWVCAMKKRRVYEYDEDVVRNIDEDITFVEKGYRSADLSAQSHKRVWAICIECGCGRRIAFKSYRDICKQCSTRTEERREQMSKLHKNKTVSYEARKKHSATLQGIPYEEWDGFVKDGEYCELFDEACRERIRAKYGNRCFICNKAQDDNIDKNGNMRKLNVHHVDMNKDQGCNGNEWKLVPVCNSCHTRLHSKKWQARIEYMVEEEDRYYTKENQK